MPAQPQILEKSDLNGSSVAEVVQIVCDDYGYNPQNPRIRNMLKRRINRSVRYINTRAPNMYFLRRVNQPFSLVAGQSDYDVTDPVANGGFGWSDCSEVMTLVLDGSDTRPLERLDLEQYRERGTAYYASGPAQSWVIVDGRRLIIDPEPAQSVTGFGDYIAQLGRLSDDADSIGGWPQAWDEAIVAGTLYYTAMAKMRERPGGIMPSSSYFSELVERIVEKDKTRRNRPQQAMATRDMRSTRAFPHDNSTDLRWGRR